MTLCMARLTRSLTGSGAATSQARPPSKDEPLCSLLPQHPISRVTTCSISGCTSPAPSSSGCCSAKKQAARYSKA
eukprot:scaffold30656_cov34-Phaeocystis_antarctica.AAC.2